MIDRSKQVIIQPAFMVVVIALLLGVSTAYAYVPDKSGAIGAGQDKTMSVGDIFDGVTKTMGDLVDVVAGDGTPSTQETKPQPAATQAATAAGKSAPQMPNAKMIEAKRLDQPQSAKSTANAATATGALSATGTGSSVPAAPPPYKVYAAPIIEPESQPAAPSQKMIPTYKAPSLPEPAAQASGAPQQRQRGKVPPPALTDDMQRNLEDYVVNPHVSVRDLKSGVRSQVKAVEEDFPVVRGGQGGQPPASALPKQFFPVFPLGAGEDTPGQLLPVSSNFDMEGNHRRITRVIIYIHDIQRNSADGVATLMTLAGPSASNTLILAPQFSLDLDIVRFANFLPENGRNVTRWSMENVWQFGGESKVSPQQRGISSFTALDILLLVLTDKQRFPSLEQVVIAGHGMGGDFVQRYAALGQAPDILAQEHLSTRFVIANPSSFMYLTNARPTANGTRIGNPDPSSVKECPRLNSYPYGLHDIISYAKSEGVNAARERYPLRHVIYLAGDAIGNDNYLDRGCEAMTQGKDRTSRTKSFSRYMDQYFSDTATGRHIFSVVTKTGYDPVSVFGSSCGMDALFGAGQCKKKR